MTQPRKEHIELLLFQAKMSKSDLAEVLNITRSAVYQHFDKSEDLSEKTYKKFLEALQKKSSIRIEGDITGGNITNVNQESSMNISGQRGKVKEIHKEGSVNSELVQMIRDILEDKKKTIEQLTQNYNDIKALLQEQETRRDAFWGHVEWQREIANTTLKVLREINNKLR